MTEEEYEAAATYALGGLNPIIQTGKLDGKKVKTDVCHWRSKVERIRSTR